MVCFCSDADILKYEPVLFSDLYFGGQVVAEGAGASVAGNVFTAVGADFLNCGIAAGGVVYLWREDGAVAAGYEVVSVDSGEQLTLSAVRVEGEAGSLNINAEGLSYRISTFRPQAAESSVVLCEYLSIRPADGADSVGAADILDAGVLRRACVYSVLAMIYAVMGEKDGDSGMWKKSLHYRRMFEKAKERLKVEIDRDGDGVSEFSVGGGSCRLRRD